MKPNPYREADECAGCHRMRAGMAAAVESQKEVIRRHMAIHARDNRLRNAVTVVVGVWFAARIVGMFLGWH